MASFMYMNDTNPFGGVSINWASDTIKVALLSPSYTPDQINHKSFSDVSASEVTGVAYTAGGTTLTSKTATADNTNKITTFSSANPLFPLVTVNTRYAVVYKSTGTAATSPLICLLDMNTTQSPILANLQLQLGSTGIFQVEAAT